jgi:double-stranded uracil-DNA glycosylase
MLARVKPTASDLRAAQGKLVPDLIAPGLAVLFCGINPSLYSAAVGHHFARPGNRFWKVLQRAGFTERVLRPEEDASLLELGIGLTNVFHRATAAASEVSTASFLLGARALERKVRRYRPRYVAFLGLTAYGVVTGSKRVEVGLQPAPFAGRRAWALPNPSGLNAHYQLDALSELYAELARAAGFGKLRSRR